MISSHFLTRFTHSFVQAEAGKVFALLERVIGSDAVTVSNAARQHHGHDESHHREAVPDVVATPKTVEQVSAAVKICNQHKFPVIPFGTGTGLEGAITAPTGGVCLDLSSLDEILSVNIEDFNCTVQPGVTRKTLNAHIHDTGLWFPIDPGADASLCGMCATSASGTNAVRYGTMKDNVINLQVVLPSGEIIYTRGKERRTKKSAAGYNLTNLFVGSEGTLGIITAATLRLYGYPEKMASAVCSFADIQSAVDSVVQTLQCGIAIARIEFLDDVQMDAINKYAQMQYPVQPTLFLEFHGTDTEVTAQASFVGEICEGNGGTSFQWAHLPEEREKLWKARHDALYANYALKPGAKGYITDVCVPVTKLPEVINGTKQDIEASGMIGPIVGHVGDGNFHCTLLVDPESDDDQKKAERLSDKIVK